MDGEAQRSSRRNVIAGVAFMVLAGVAVYLFVPRLAGLDDTWQRIEQGAPEWLALALLCEMLSYVGYVIVFRAAVADRRHPISWRDSYDITMAGVAATRIFAAAGAGGIALTAWALAGLGMARAEIIRRTTTLLVLLYTIYGASLVVFGLGLWFGLFPGSAPFGVTVIPAGLGVLAFVIAGVITLFPRGVEARLRGHATDESRRRRWAAQAALVPALVGDGLRGAVARTRERRPGLVGAPLWWIGDIATLWACFQAFGGAPELAVVIMGYFVGMAANALPLPGGVGGVEGGMIGAFVAFGVDGGLAIVAVLTYRAFAFWLPTVPGVISYWRLRRRLSASPAPVAA